MECSNFDVRGTIAAVMTATVLAVAFMGCVAGKSSRDIPVVKGFEAARYMGVWHEIARLPKWFERDLSKVTATYLLDGDVVRITNRGFRNGEEKVSTAVGHFAGTANEPPPRQIVGL